MAEKMTPPPEPQSADSGADLLTILKHALDLGAAVPMPAADDASYSAIMDAKLPKFSGPQVGFKRGGAAEGGGCRSCWSYFLASGPARKKAQHGACEIMRPADGPSVEPGDMCSWWSKNGLEFPHRDKGQQDEKGHQAESHQAKNPEQEPEEPGD